MIPILSIFQTWNLMVTYYTYCNPCLFGICYFFNVWFYGFHCAQVNHGVTPSFFSMACHAVSCSLHAQASTSRTVGFHNPKAMHHAVMFPRNSSMHIYDPNKSHEPDLCSTYGFKGHIVQNVQVQSGCSRWKARCFAGFIGCN